MSNSPLKTQPDLRKPITKTGNAPKKSSEDEPRPGGTYSIKPHDVPSHEEILRKTR